MERWQRMAGGCGSLLTGHCLIRHGQPEVLASVETVVRFAPLSQAEIEAYVASGEPLQCAGGFALEGRGGLCIDGLDGCYSNVIGLSLPWLRQQLSASLSAAADFSSPRSLAWPAAKPPAGCC